MKEKNICKFIEKASFEALETYNFIYETSPDVMKSEYILKRNRMALIKQGEGNLMIDGVSYTFLPGNLIFTFEGETIRFNPSENTEYMYIEFSGSRADMLFSIFLI